MAAPNLPVGVIKNNTDGVSRDLRNIDVLTVEEVAQLWTTYNSKQALLDNDIGRRLTYFFWRLWSSDQLRTRLSGSQVALLFESISEGSIIRTTPRSSPRHSRIISATQTSIEAVEETVEEVRRLSRESSDSSQNGPSTPGSQTRGSATSESSSLISEDTNRRSSRDQIQPTPILKKPGQESSGTSKTARIQPPAFKTAKNDPDHDEPMSPEEAEELSRQLSDESAVTVESIVGTEPDTPTRTPRAARASSTELISQLQGNAAPRMSRTSSSSQIASRGSRKKPSFVASSSRRRPIITRRQSSQTSNSSAPRTSPALKSSSTFDNFAALTEVGSPEMRRTNSVPVGDEAPTGYKLTSSRSASPLSHSPFRRVSKDHQSHERGSTPAAIHNRALSAFAPGSEFVPSSGPSSGPNAGSSESRRDSTSTSFKNGAVTPRRSLASSSSSNVQAAGQLSLDELTSSSLSNPSRTAMNVFSRASSFFTAKGKGRAMFDLGPPETDSADTSRRPSLDVSQAPISPRTTSSFSTASASLPQSRSQSQLSDLLDQDRRREAERDRKRVLEERARSQK